MRPSSVFLVAAGVALASVSLARSRAPKSCPSEMAPVPGRPGVCIDRWEASLDGKRAVSRAGRVPAVKVSQVEARAACDRAGKRLCRRDEWVAACRGEGARRKFSYGGDVYQAGRCNDRKRSGGAALTPLPTGSIPECRTPEGEGVYDLSGNVWEWLADTNPDGQTATLIGGGYGNDDDDDILACEPEDPFAQPINQRAEAVGFRCCRSL